MPLGKFQLQIISALEQMGRLTEEQREKIASTPDELTGDALDKLLLDEYKVTSLQLLVSKGKAFGLAPYHVARYKVNPATFERLPQDFCQEHQILPVGQVGDYLIVAFANPFEISLPA